MDTSSQNSVNDLTRRQFLHHSGKAALAASLAGFALPLARTTTRAASSDNTTLVVISQTGASPDRVLPKALKDFEAANPGVTTKLVLYPEEKFVAMYTAAQTAGEHADLLNLNGQDLRRYATSNALLSFTSISYKDRFIPEALAPYTVNGQLWGLPAGAAGGFVVFTNQALLDRIGLKAPATYEEMKEVGNALRAKGCSAFTHPGKIIYMWPVWFFTTFAQTSGNRSIERTVEILSEKENSRIPMSLKRSILFSSFHETSYSVLGCSAWTLQMRRASSKLGKLVSICSTTRSRKACTMRRVNN